MKTTIELPDELFVAAKRRAAELRQPLRALIEDSLRARLQDRPGGSKPGRRRRIRWVTVNAGLPRGLDVASREAMYDWLRTGR